MDDIRGLVIAAVRTCYCYGAFAHIPRYTCNVAASVITQRYGLTTFYEEPGLWIITKFGSDIAGHLDGSSHLIDHLIYFWG